MTDILRSAADIVFSRLTIEQLQIIVMLSDHDIRACIARAIEEQQANENEFQRVYGERK